MAAQWKCLAKLHGDLRIVDLRRSHARTFREALQLVPKRRKGVLRKASLPVLSEYERYRSDPAYRDAVIAKLGRSNIM